MRQTGWVYLLWMGLGLWACQPTDYETIEVENRFQIEVPSYLSEKQNMHPDAPLQMSNAYRHTYLLVRYDSIPDYVDNLGGVGLTLEDFYIYTFEGLLPGISVPYPDSLTINGLQALRTRIDSHHEGEALRYDLTLIQGQDVLYQVLSWVAEDDALEFEADQERILQSFKEM